jgi:hypothetical protein
MKTCFFSLIFAALAFSAVAKDRALLIGVGKYQIKSANLPGIGLDIGKMKQVANSLGFEQIKVLQDEQATLTNIEHALSAWLVDGVAKNDRVLIYYSGHGTNIADENGDEDDGQDEALATHDMVLHAGSLKNLLLDDRFEELLNQIPSGNKLVILDACHSGTATRASNFRDKRYVPKVFEWEGMGTANKSLRPAAETKPKEFQGNILTISAAQDNEQSLATDNGSLFTSGLSHVIQQARTGNKALSPTAIKIGVSNYVQQNISNNSLVFHPQLSGDSELFQQPIFAELPIKANNGGTIAQRLTDLLSLAQPLTVTLNQSQFKKNDNLIIHVSLDRSGFLNIVEINANDEATVLFPNKYHQNNMVGSGSFTLPSTQMNFNLSAGEPFGRSLIVAFLSTEKLNLFSNELGGNGRFEPLFKSFSEPKLQEISRAFTPSPTQKHKAFLAGKVETKVCASDVAC